MPKQRNKREFICIKIDIAGIKLEALISRKKESDGIEECTKLRLFVHTDKALREGLHVTSAVERAVNKEIDAIPFHLHRFME